MSARERDAMIAHTFFDWRWVEGEGPIRLGLAQAHWLLPSGKDLSKVTPDEAETLNLSSAPATFTLKSLPHYSSDIGAAWSLVEGYDQVEIKLLDGEWICALRFKRAGRDTADMVEAIAKGPTASLAICRAAYKASRANSIDPRVY